MQKVKDELELIHRGDVKVEWDFEDEEGKSEEELQPTDELRVLMKAYTRDSLYPYIGDSLSKNDLSAIRNYLTSIFKCMFYSIS